MHCINLEQHFSEIGEYFNNLPPQLYQQGRLLRNNLTIHFSDTGRFEDILYRVSDYPQVCMPSWFLDDFAFLDDEARNGIEKHLFIANLLAFAIIYIQDSILDERSFFDHEYIFLANELSQQVDHHFKYLFPANSVFWSYHHQFWVAYSQAMLSRWGTRPERIEPVSAQDVHQSIDLLAPYKLIPLSVVLLAGREHQIPQLLTLMDHLHVVQLILHDLITLEEDLQQGKVTYPIIKLMAELGVPLVNLYNPEGLLLAMTLTNSFSKIIAECTDHTKSCKTIARQLKLKSFMAYLEDLEVIVQEIAETNSGNELYDRRKESSEQVIKTSPFVNIHHTNTLAQTIHMAEGYLLSDPTFKESWEVHRRGLAGAAEVTARFPAGLILEILCSHGHDLSAQVDSFFQHYQDANFSYYDHPELPYADSDSLGVLLRLYHYTSNPNSWRKSLEIPLGWMQSSVQSDGRVPVWINESETQDRGSMRLIGDGCGTIEAKLLCGLIQYDWEKYQVIIHDSAAQLFDRFFQQGAGITVNYPRSYCLWRINQLITCLRMQPIKESLKNRIQAASDVYDEQISIAIKQYQISPQEAAFLTLASLSSPAERLFNQRWLTIMLKDQRSDGSWVGYPLFFVPNRGELTTWHLSHQLTTAFCYHALKTYSDSLE